MKKVLQKRRKVKVRKAKCQAKGSGCKGFADMWGDESGQQDSAHPRTVIPIGLNIVKETGAYVHNFRYAAQFLQDSYQALSGISPPSVRPSSSDDSAATIYTYP